MTTLYTILSLIPFYLLGAFPTGLLVARLHGVDITQAGSGNVGATNVSRVVGKKAGIVTLAVDVLKGIIGVLLAALLTNSDWFSAAAGVAVVYGHCFSVPPWLRGGKGVATALGVLIATYPASALVALITFAVVFAARKIVSLSSIASTLMVPTVSLVMNAPEYISLSQALIAAMLIFRHRENITRLIEGRESTFAFRKE